MNLSINLAQTKKDAKTYKIFQKNHNIRNCILAYKKKTARTGLLIW